VSGFAGIVRLESGAESAEKDRPEIEQMARAIAFRGPDAWQQTLQPGAAFAFSLLTTGPAPQESSQPCTLDGEIWFLGDARCDGREALMLKLAQHGRELPSSASSEHLVLQAFAQFGELALPDLDGDFSFVLWNPRERKLIAFRDLSGSRPFFYAHRDGILVFSNTMQALFSHPAVSRRQYDLQFMGDFLLGSPHHDPERSVYRDVRRLPAGSLLEYSPQGLSVRRIANLPIEDLLQLRDEEVIEEFRELFSQAVADRLPSRMTTLLLSGGLDSTSISASAVNLRKLQPPGAPLNLRALTLDPLPLFHDEEGLYAKRFAKSLGLPFELLHVGHILPFEGIGSISALLPEPAPWLYWALAPFYFSRIAQVSRVALSGDGGDEILRGHGGAYVRYLSSRSGYASAAGTLLRYVIASRKLPALGAGIRSGVLRIIGRPPMPPMFPQWFTKEAEQTWNLRDRFASINARRPSAHHFNPRAHSLVNSPVFAAGMEEQDCMWTGFPVERRMPFLDRRLLRFLLRLAPIPWLMEKEVIRRAQQSVLPDEIRLRPKAPLRHDPLLLHVANGKWSPPVPHVCPEPLGLLLDWAQLRDLLCNCGGPSLRLELRPVGLALWLMAVENGRGIQ